VVIHDPETERAVLGCVLSGSKPSEVPLPPEAFTEARRHVWESMQALEAEHRGIDHLTLAEMLQRRGRLAECGGPGALNFESAHPPHLEQHDIRARLPAYVPILRNRMLRRQLAAAAENLRRQAEDLGQDPVLAGAAAAAALSTIRGERALKRGGDLVYRLVDKWDANRTASAEGRRVTPCLPWPHEGMDTGVPRGRVSVVAGRSGNFKSGLVSDGMMFWAKSMQEQGGLIGLEDGVDWFTERLAGRATGVPYEQVGYAPLDDGQQTALGNWCATTHEALDARMFYEDFSETGDAATSISFPEVFSVIQKMTEAGAKWIVIDHGLRIDWAKGSGVDRYDMAIGQGMARCSRYAERTGVAIIFLWHLNRAQQEGSVPQRSDLKESGYVDAEARKIYVLWKQAHRPGYQLCTTVKATKGEEGYTVALPLYDALYGLLGLTKGRVVDFEAEAAEARQRAAEAKKQNSGKRPKLFTVTEE
jgi:replicative DNA helicase